MTRQETIIDSISEALALAVTIILCTWFTCVWRLDIGTAEFFRKTGYHYWPAYLVGSFIYGFFRGRHRAKKAGL